MNNSDSNDTIIDLGNDERAEYLGRWWAMRKHAIDVGIIAERALIEAGEMSEADRRFYNRQEWRKLTER